MDIENSTVLITGGGGGIGSAMGQSFAARGARVILCDISHDRAQAAADAIGHGCAAARLDVTSDEEWASLRATVGAVDLLCCNAGVAHTSPLDVFDQDGFRWAHEVNFWGALRGVQTFVPGMKERGRGHVLFTCSITALRPVPTASAYSSSKAALANAALALGMELRGSGVGVSVLMPGLVATGLRGNSDNIWATSQGDRQPAAERPVQLLPGMPADAIGRAVVEAVENDRFWIFPHEGYRPTLEREVALISEAMTHSPMPDYRDPPSMLEPMH